MCNWQYLIYIMVHSICDLRLSLKKFHLVVTLTAVLTIFYNYLSLDCCNIENLSPEESSNSQVYRHINDIRSRKTQYAQAGRIFSGNINAYIHRAPLQNFMNANNQKKAPRPAVTFGSHTINVVQHKPLPIEDCKEDIIKPMILYNSSHLLSQYKMYKGRHWQPSNQTNGPNIAIMIPFKDRKSHLSKWLLHMIPFLQRQQADFTIFVIEQANNDIFFNKGILYNAGFMEINKLGHYDCFILHDVDLLPENLCNLYQCDKNQIVHLSPSVDTLQYRLPYGELVGGAIAIEPHIYRSLNGFTNLFYGWGGEDDDFSVRLASKDVPISRSRDNEGRYTMLKHDRIANMKRGHNAIIEHALQHWKCDGLNSLQYNVTNIARYSRYINIRIYFDAPHTYKLAKIPHPKCNDAKGERNDTAN